MLFEERKEDLLRAGLQEQRGGAEERSSAAGRGFADCVQALLAVVDEGHHGMGQHSDSNAGFGEFLQGGKTQSRAGSARLQQSRQRLIQCRDGEVDAYGVVPGNLS
jgi:hypothetical protein